MRDMTARTAPFSTRSVERLPSATFEDEGLNGGPAGVDAGGAALATGVDELGATPAVFDVVRPRALPRAFGVVVTAVATAVGCVALSVALGAALALAVPLADVSGGTLPAFFGPRDDMTTPTTTKAP